MRMRSPQPTMIIRWRVTGRMVALLMLAAGSALSGKAESAELPVPPKEAVQPAGQMHKTCVGMDGKPFRWDSANVPFASNCQMEEDKQAAPPSPGTK